MASDKVLITKDSEFFVCGGAYGEIFACHIVFFFYPSSEVKLSHFSIKTLYI